MKTYIFTKEYRKSRNYENVLCNIYRVKNNKPVYIGVARFSTGSSRKAISEVFCTLIELKEIPQSFYNLSKTDRRSGGYYCDKVEEKGIKIIEL